MLSNNEKEQITQLVHQQVVPAIGCTEPICVALAASRAAEVLECVPTKIEAHLSANILKNAMGVGIPGTGMVGLPIAIALGATIGKSDLGLEVLRHANPEAVEHGKEYIAQKSIHIELKADAPEKLYVEIVAHDDANNTARVIIAREHTHYIYIAKNDTVILNDPLRATDATTAPQEGEKLQLNLRKVWEYATTMPLSEINFINEARRLNEAAARQSLEGNYGHCLGKVLSRPMGRGIMGDNIFSHIISSTACACDARMAGAMSSTQWSVSFIASAPMLTKFRILRSTSSSIIPSTLVTQLPCIANIAESTAVLTPVVSFMAQLGFAPSQIIPVRLAIMFFTAKVICS